MSVVFREDVLRAAGFKPRRDMKRALRATREAMTATNKEGEPDHAIRLRAAEQVYELADVKPKAIHQSLTQVGSLTIRWDMSAQEIPPASPLTALSSTFSEGSNGSASSSAIADGERPPSA